MRDKTSNALTFIFSCWVGLDNWAEPRLWMVGLSCVCPNQTIEATVGLTVETDVVVQVLTGGSAKRRKLPCLSVYDVYRQSLDFISPLLGPPSLQHMWGSTRPCSLVPGPIISQPSLPTTTLRKQESAF